MTAGQSAAALSENGESTPEPDLWSGPNYSESGVDLTLLRAHLALSPIDRLRRMERHARDIKTLMAYGERHRLAKPG